MKKIALFGLGATAALSLVACTVGETSEGSAAEVSNYEYLPVCSTQKNLSGNSLIGTKIYVSEEEAYYLCTEKGWKVTDGATTTIPDYVIDSATVTGSVQLGGSFEIGSKVILHEVKLGAKNVLDTTKVFFEDEISSDKGDFVIPGVHLSYDYALVEVSGKFQDFATGELSGSDLTLYSLVDLSEDKTVNVNLLSTLEYARVKTLVKNGYSVKAAKLQAEKEILNALGFAGEVENVDAAMIALSVVLRQGDDGMKELSKQIEAFAADLADDGIWNNKKTRIAMADFAYALENLKLKDDNNEVVLKLSDIRRNLESFGVNAPAFESYVNQFWISAYGLGGCGSAREGAVVQNAAAESDSSDAYFTCASGAWRTATDFERDTVYLGTGIDGELKEGNVDNAKVYAYDSTGAGAGTPVRWVEADSLVIAIGASCTDDIYDNRDTVISTKNEDGGTDYYSCKDRKWSPSTKQFFKIGHLCNDRVDDAIEMVVIDKDTSYFHCKSDTAEIAGVKKVNWNWDVYTKPQYVMHGVECNPDKIAKGKNDVRYICDDKEKLNWREADPLEIDNNLPCTKYNVGVVNNSGSRSAPDYYRCEVSYGAYSWAPSDSIHFKMSNTVCDESKIVSLKEDEDYVCTGSVVVDGDTLYDNWRKATSQELSLKKTCSASSNFGEEDVIDTYMYKCTCTVGLSLASTVDQCYVGGVLVYPIGWTKKS